MDTGKFAYFEGPNHELLRVKAVTEGEDIEVEPEVHLGGEWKPFHGYELSVADLSPIDENEVRKMTGEGASGRILAPDFVPYGEAPQRIDRDEVWVN
jgi:hypothetical protein